MNFFKYFALMLFTSCATLKAQIVFEHKYDSASTGGNIGGYDYPSQLMMINFEVSGEQYVKINMWGKVISIYGLNHALIQNISYASFPQSANNAPEILYLSEHLFNTDPMKEFMYFYHDVPGTFYTRIYREDGTMLFSDTAFPLVAINAPQQQYPIYNTTNGTKMILSYANGDAKVFGLPGTLTTAVDKTSHAFISHGSVSNAYPNPVINSTRVDYLLPDGVHNGEIVFYDTQGIEIKRFKVDKEFDHLLVSTNDIPAGTYYYQLQTKSNSSIGKKMVVIK